jgi:hypothetical protein
MGKATDRCRIQDAGCWIKTKNDAGYRITTIDDPESSILYPASLLTSPLQ